MPNSATLSSRVETAAKCFDTAASPSAATTRARALAALAMVSCVVKVFDETMNSVRERSSGTSVSARSAPSTLATRPRVAKGRQGARRHRRPEVGAANSYVHDIGEGFFARAQNHARPDIAREGEDTLARRLDLAPHIDALHDDRLVGEIAQPHVHCGAPFGVVDRLAGKQRRAPALEIARPG